MFQLCLSARVTIFDMEFGFGMGFTRQAYIISPKFCHRFMGYVEEEAYDTYTNIIKAIENAPAGSELAAWKTQAPPQIAVLYWKLPSHQATVLDVMYAVRADEPQHRDGNHLMSGVKEGQVNPLYDPESSSGIGACQKYCTVCGTS